MCAPLWVQILSISCSFWEILAKSYVGAPPPPHLGGLAPPPRGNPRSATINNYYLKIGILYPFCLGIGAFVFAPMCKFLIDEYAWQGAQWIVSAIVLNGLVLGAVYRPLTFDDLERVRRKWRKKQIKLEARRLNVNVEQIKDNKSEESVSLNSQNIDETDSKSEERAMLSRVHQLQQYGSDVRYPNLRMRTVSSSSIDKSETNLNSMRTIGDSCHSLTWYASSMEKLHENSAPERSALSVRTRASQKSKPAQEKQSFMDILKDVLNGVRDTMDFTMLTNPVFVIYGLSCIFCMAGKTKHMSISLSGGVWAETPLDRDPFSLTKIPWTETPYSKEQVVRILLACILVSIFSAVISGGSKIYQTGEGANP